MFTPLKITTIANKLNLKEKDLFLYGNEIAKIENFSTNKINGKLIVVTAINPTPEGEGKTTLSIGLIDALNANGYNCVGALRQPSMGPVFGLKGSAFGGGKTCLFPKQRLSLNFTGDFHAITAANNLISSIIDNEIYFNNDLEIDPETIIWNRCLDSNDRGLRNVNLKIKKDICYNTHFNITAASDIMALFCLVNNKDEFKTEIKKTVIASNKDGKDITINDLEIVESLGAILDDAFKPNLIQTEENNPVLIHGGPFANIAHGCNSIIATKMALKLGDYVVTECGFGADLGLEKFMDIKMRRANLFPNLIVICLTVKSLILHGNFEKPVGISILRNGFKNLLVHVNHCKYYGINPLIIINVNSQDLSLELEEVYLLCCENNLNYAISNMYKLGSQRTKELSDYLVSKCKNYEPTFLYDLSDDIEIKIKKICLKAYQINKITYSELASEQLKTLINQKEWNICIAKTPFSLSSDPKKLNFNENMELKIESFYLNWAAKLIVVNCAKIIKMPGLSKVPRAKNFKI